MDDLEALLLESLTHLYTSSWIDAPDEYIRALRLLSKVVYSMLTIVVVCEV